jgi:molybdopterin-guanine dinucleotide biosynthesis protein
MQIRSSDLAIPTDNPFKNDCLNRRDLEPPLTQFVTQAVGPFVLAVDGSWGSGKTTFLKMWRVKLDDAGHLCLYLNAWKTDFVQDPLVAVVGELSIAIKKHPLDRLDEDNVRKTIEKIEKTARLIVKRLIPVGAKLLTLGALDIDSALEREVSAGTSVVAENLIQDYKKGKTDIEAFREDLEFLANAIQEPNQDPVKIIIIIDELDRCRPTYAVQLLERIKHLFDVEGVVFVLGIDRKQLSHSVKALYGSEFDATGYLKRFIDMDYLLPEPSLECYCSYLFERFGITSLMEKRQGLSKNSQTDCIDLKLYLGYLMSSAKMNLRNQEQVVSRLRVVLQTISTNEKIYPITLSILLFLREYDPEKYTLITKASLTAKDFLSFVETLPNEKEAFKVFSMFRTNARTSFSKDLMEAALCSETTEDIKIKKPGKDSSSEIEYIHKTPEADADFKETKKRLNLTSNFVQNQSNFAGTE